jgi:hypothetical protein
MAYPVTISQEMINCFHENYTEDDEKSIQVVLIQLRKSGYSQMQSIFLLIDRLNITFVNANLIIMQSEAWNS